MSKPSATPSTLPTWLRRAPWVLMALTVILHLPHVLEAGWAIDDTLNLQQHARHGDLAGEWTTPTYAHAGGERGHIWRPIPATLQHLAAMGLGREGWVFRGLNLSIHLLNIGLLFAWLRSRRARPEVAGLLVTAWALHPTGVEAIAWSSDIYDLLACSCALSMLWGLDRLRSLSAQIACVGLGILAACLCKESAVALVGLIWLLLVWAPPDGLKTKSRLGIGAAALVGAMVWMQWHGQITTDSYGEALAQAPHSEQALAWLGSTSWIVFPPNRAWLAHLFDPSDWTEPLFGALTLGLLGTATLGLLRRNIAEGRALGVATLTWMGLLIPAGVGMALIGIQPLRYAYLPLALFVGLLGGLSPLIERHPRAWLVGIAGYGLLGLGLSGLRLPDWKNDSSLWAAEHAREPDNPYAMGGLARAWIGDGRDTDGIRIWEQAIDTAPHNIRLFNLQEERYLLAQTTMGLEAQNRIDTAEAATLTMKMCCQIITDHQQRDLPLPAENWRLLDLMADSERIQGVAVESAAQLLGYCSMTGSDADPSRSERPTTSGE